MSTENPLEPRFCISEDFLWIESELFVPSFPRMRESRNRRELDPRLRGGDDANAKSGLNVLDLGYADYQSTWDLQKRIVEDVVLGRSSETLILVEHPHVITRGLKYHGAPKPKTDLPVFDIERGGGPTYHGPGQLVGYPIIHLTRRGLKIADYIRTLEGLLIESLFQFGIKGERAKGFTGVWVGNKKVASIGVAVRRWVTYHGLALNVNTDLNYFKAIHPCGLQPEVMTSMEAILGHPISMDEVKKFVIQAFEEKFDSLSRETILDPPSVALV